MTAALTLVRMRWALTWATLRKSVWQTIGYAIALVMAAGTVVGVAVMAWFIGDLPPFVPSQAPGFPPVNILGPSGVVNSVVVLVGAFLTLAVGLFQIMLIGEGSTMSPRKFALYGIPDRELQFGLLLSGLTGTPAITGLLSLMLWAMAFRMFGPAIVIVALAAAPIAVLTMMSVSKMLLSLSTVLVTSKRGTGVFYIVIVMLFVSLMQIPSIVLNSGAADGFSLDGVALVASLVAWTPFGAPFQLPYDAMLGDWPVLLARIAILAIAWILCFMVCTWCLRRERLTVGAGDKAVKTKGIGAFGWMPDSPSGAVSARLLTYLRRDPRQAMMFVMPVFFLVIFSLQAHGISGIVWQVLIWSGWGMAIVESNGLAYDGRGFTMQVIAGVPGFTDRIGRVRVYASIIVVYMAILFVAVAVITGDWARPGGLVTGLTFAAAGLGVAFSGLGLAEITSCVLMYPVASMDKPFSSPQGRMVAQGFFPFVYLIGSFLAMLPTGITAIIMIAVFPTSFGTIYWLLIPIALLNGVGALALGSWLGGKLLDARMLSVVHTLDSFASLQK
ncbi:MULTISPECIES: ABC transporter permease [Bifidobacterium]|uniref:ABC transporter permease n=1 Tax=Bifidobacterium TaxID=1678 RepID=UPI001BDC8B27|nr:MULTISPECIES: ABC transporter permease [Bifidobacterium]MBT1162064.1 ABC transporter permease [Bifidobacterium sp. SO1]MBW3078013.1 ABC transporter permease [Bifidobacterium simiiventris]